MNSKFYNKIWRKLWTKAGKKTLAILLSFIVFVIMFLTMTIIAFIVLLLFKHGIINELTEPTIKEPLIILMVVSCIIGTLLTAVLGNRSLKPLHLIVDACNKVASGDFSVRLPMSSIEEFNTFAMSFNRMVQELNSVELLRSDFVNNFSHEFKTPIVSLRGFAKILKNPALSEEERNEYLDIIISESDRLSKLSSNVLTATTVDNLSIISTVSDFDLSEQIRRNILMLEPKWSAKGLEIIVDLDDIIYLGNEDLLSQVSINILDNAIKFSPQNGKIKVKLKKSEDEIIFEVIDTGYGIEPENISRIFDKFYQCDKSHSAEGNGLGLPIVKKIVTLHKGDISVLSELGVGTNFRVSLPVTDSK